MGDPYDLKLHEDTPTCVFWNVEDYPIPNGRDPASIFQDMEEAIKKQGCRGEVSIQAYVDKNTFSDELRRKYSDAGFKVKLFPEGGELARFHFIVFDIVLWVFENDRPPPNVIVLFKNITRDLENPRRDRVYHFESLVTIGCCVLLSETQPGWQLPSGSSALFLTSLFDGSSQRLDNMEIAAYLMEETVAGSSQLVRKKKRKITDALKSYPF